MQRVVIFINNFWNILKEILVDVDLKLKGKMKISGLFSKNRFEENYGILLDDFIKTAEKLV